MVAVLSKQLCPPEILYSCSLTAEIDVQNKKLVLHEYA